jgi:hypothetical protein
VIYEASTLAIAVFLAFVFGTVGFSFYLGRRTKSSEGYFAAHGQVPWAINGDRVCRRLSLGRVVLGHLRDDRDVRLRRLPVLDRLPWPDGSSRCS